MTTLIICASGMLVEFFLFSNGLACNARGRNTVGEVRAHISAGDVNLLNTIQAKIESSSFLTTRPPGTWAFKSVMGGVKEANGAYSGFNCVEAYPSVTGTTRNPAPPAKLRFSTSGAPEPNPVAMTRSSKMSIRSDSRIWYSHARPFEIPVTSPNS